MNVSIKSLLAGAALLAVSISSMHAAAGVYLRGGPIHVMPTSDVIDSATGLLVQTGTGLDNIDLGLELGWINFDAEETFGDLRATGEETLLPIMASIRSRVPLTKDRALAFQFGAAAGTAHDEFKVRVFDGDTLIGRDNEEQWAFIWSGDLSLNYRPPQGRLDVAIGYKYIRAEIDDFALFGVPVEGGSAGAHAFYVTAGVWF